MNTEDDLVPEMIYEDVRLVLSQKTPARNRDFSGAISVHILAVTARWLGRFLGRPAVLAIVLSGMLIAAFIAKVERNSDVVGTNLPEASRAGLASILNSGVDAKEIATDGPASPELGSVYLLRVATFRNPSNAERLAASLREKSTPVRIEILAGGLHAVTLGPFNQKSTATETAREVQELRGLAPQILRRNKSE